MTIENPACGTDTGLPGGKDTTISNCHGDAVLLAGALDAVALMLAEDGGGSGPWREPIVSVVEIAAKQAHALADALDGMSS